MIQISNLFILVIGLHQKSKTDYGNTYMQGKGKFQSFVTKKFQNKYLIINKKNKIKQLLFLDEKQNNFEVV